MDTDRKWHNRANNTADEQLQLPLFRDLGYERFYDLLYFIQVKLKDQYRKAEANDQLSFYRAFKHYHPSYNEETPSECSCNFWLSHYLPCVHIWFDSQFDSNPMTTAQVDLYVDRWISIDEGIGTCNTTTVYKEYRHSVLPLDDFEDGFIDAERKAPIDRNQHMLLHTLVDGMKEEFYRLAAEAKPRTTKQEFDRYIHFLHDHYNAILAVDLDKITLDHYRDGGAGDAAIIGKRQYAADQFRYTATVLLDEDGIDDNALLGTIDDEAGALSMIHEDKTATAQHEEELGVVDETAQYEVDETAQYEVDETTQHEEELGMVHDTATAKATAKAQHEEELGVAEVENITTLFESTVGVAPTQSLAKLRGLFDTTIEPQTPAPLRAPPTKSSPFHLYAPTNPSSPFHLHAPTNPSPLRMQSALPPVAEFDYSEFPSQLSQTSPYPAARQGPAAYAVTAGVAQFNAAFGMQVEEDTGHIRRIAAKPPWKRLRTKYKYDEAMEQWNWANTLSRQVTAGIRTSDMYSPPVLEKD